MRLTSGRKLELVLFAADRILLCVNLLDCVLNPLAIGFSPWIVLNTCLECEISPELKGRLLAALNLVLSAKPLLVATVSWSVSRDVGFLSCLLKAGP